MISYEYLVNDNIGQTLGVFDTLWHALLFIRALYIEYESEDNLTLTIVKQEKE